MNPRAPMRDMTGGGRRKGGRGGGARMDAQTRLLEPFLLKQSGLHWTLLTSTDGAELSDVRILETKRKERVDIQPFNRAAE